MVGKVICTVLVFLAFASAVKATQKKAGGRNEMQMKDVPREAVDAALGKFESSRDRLEASYNSMYKLTKPTVAHVDSQIVSGVMYHFTVFAGLSSCRKGDVDFQSCSFDPQPAGQTFMQCHIKVWSQPWRRFLEAEDMDIEKDCQPFKNEVPKRT